MIELPLSIQCFLLIIIVSIIGGIIIYKKDTNKKSKLLYSQFCLDREDTYKKMQQEWDDKQLERDARSEGHDMFQQWLNGHDILIPYPIIKFIKCHYPYESKYSSEDVSKIRNEEFHRLKKKYEDKHGKRDPFHKYPWLKNKNI